MFCVKCGKQINDDSTFCPFCGQPVSNRQAVNTKQGTLKKGMTKQMKWGIGIAAGVVVTIVSIVAIVHHTKEEGEIKQEMLADKDASKNVKEESSADEDNKAAASFDIPIDIPLFKKVTREDIFEALRAYQDYYLNVKDNMEGEILQCQFVHLDNDKIPECIILDDAGGNAVVPRESFLHLLTYKDGRLIEHVEALANWDFLLNPQTGTMLVKSSSGNSTYGEWDTDSTIIRLSDTFQIESVSYSEYYDEAENMVGFDAKINDQPASSEEDVDSYLDSLQCTSKIEFDILYRTSLDDRGWVWNVDDPHPIVNLYILQNATCYGDSWPFISFCEFKDGILTVKFDDESEFSCPVAKDCFYDAGYANYPGRLADSGIISCDMDDLYNFGEWVEKSRENYVAFGEESYEQNAGVTFYIIDGEVVEIFAWSP